jgi:hypothetical protein
MAPVPGLHERSPLFFDHCVAAARRHVIDYNTAFHQHFVLAPEPDGGMLLVKHSAPALEASIHLNAATQTIDLHARAKAADDLAEHRVAWPLMIDDEDRVTVTVGERRFSDPDAFSQFVLEHLLFD